MAANVVWSIPQYSLGIASLRQNLFADILGDAGTLGGNGEYVAAAMVLAVALSAGMVYSVGGKGVKIFEICVKGLVGMTVMCFMAVVLRLLYTGQVQMGEILGGFVFKMNLLSEPVKGFADQIALVDASFRDFWQDQIVGWQRDVMISAGATAVGINMTFLLPYSMLRKGWDRDFRGLAIFDLSTGLFFPFMIATSCVVIASASMCHAIAAPGLLGETNEAGELIEPAANLVGPFNGLLEGRVKKELGDEAFAALTPDALESDFAGLTEAEVTTKLGQEAFAALAPEAQDSAKAALPEADRKLAAMVVRRDAFNLSAALAPIAGDKFAKYVFGMGVMGMALGASTMLMLINGLCFCALLDKPAKGWRQRVGMLMPTVAMVAVLRWEGAMMWLAIPTSVFCMVLLPLAYLSFFLLMNQKKYLKDDLPKGIKRVLWNVLMSFSLALATFGAGFVIISKLGYAKAAMVIGGFILLMIIGHFFRKPDAEGAE